MADRIGDAAANSRDSDLPCGVAAAIAAAGAFQHCNARMGILLLAAGLLERDGRFLLGGYVMFAASVIFSECLEYKPRGGRTLVALVGIVADRSAS